MTNGRLTGLLLGVLVICLVAGGVGAFLLGRQDAVQAAGGPGTGSVGPPTDSGSGQAGNTPPAETGKNGAPSEGQDPATTEQSPSPTVSDPAPTADTGAENSAGAGQSAGDSTARDTANDDPDGDDQGGEITAGDNTAGDGDNNGSTGSEGEPGAGSTAESADETAPAPGESSGTEDTGSTRAEQSSGTTGTGVDDEDRQVRIAEDVGEHPRAADIRDLAQAYFDAINAHNFADWQATVTPEEADSTDEAAWSDAYSTTEDTFVVIAAIDDEPLQARVTFISRQDPAKAANDKDCTSWAITLPVIEQDGRGLVFGRSEEGKAQARDCAG